MARSRRCIRADRYDGLHEIAARHRRCRARARARGAAVGASARPRGPARRRSRTLAAAAGGARRPRCAAAVRGGRGPAPRSTALHDLLRRAIVATPPALLRDGGVIATGYDAELDELRSIATGADTHLLELEERERRRTGIAQLKVGYNRVHGYLHRAAAQPVGARAADYQRRQTLKNAERYITPELKAVRGQGARRRRPRARAREAAVRRPARSPDRASLPRCSARRRRSRSLDVLAGPRRARA